VSESYLQTEERFAHLSEERARGDAFERVIAHFLRHDPTLGMRRVWTWLDWPGRLAAGIRATDLGIDLVAEDELGELVGVQVKFRLDPRSHLRWEEVSTALGFRPDLFARRLIVTNAADRTANARRATEMTPNTGWILRDDLLASPIDWTGALTAGTGESAPVRLVRTPRPYQTAAVLDVVASMAQHERTQLVMACGSGKTLVMLWIAEARADERILVLVPTLLLLKQFRREWREAATLPFVDLAVCSDADTVEPDEWRVRADELGVPVTTDPATIAAFLRGAGRRVVFATYASSARVAEAQATAGVPAFDLVVADEAHRVAGVVNIGIHRERDLRVVLDAGRIRASRRLFATATPRVYGPGTRRSAEGLDDVEIASMDDEALFGPVAHRLWFRAAVDLGVLTDYQLVAVLVTDAEVADLVRGRAGVIVEGKVLDAETLATLIAIRRAIDDLELTRAITFHHTIARARGFALALTQIGLTSLAPVAEHVSGAMSVDERERVLHILREPDRPTVVTNARCLTEGIDVPSLDAVAFVDPRSSAVDIVQAVGRVMRTALGKDRGYVVVPVFLQEADLANPEAAVESSAFARVLEVLRALRAHDPELTSDASRIKGSLGTRDAVAGGHIAEHVRLLGIGVDLRRFERALELRFVDVSAEPFAVGLAALLVFAAREGHARVPTGHVEDGLSLGAWVNRCRTERKARRLDPARAAELEAVAGWSWEPNTDDWNANLAALRLFVAREGHARVPRHHVEGGLRLENWVHSQRVGHNAGRLTSAREADLETFAGWTWDPRTDDWDKNLLALRAFAAREGHAHVPRSHVEDGLRLGAWANARRTERNAGRLDPADAAELEAFPGWTWEPRTEDWNANLAALRVFVAREGHARVPIGHIETGLRLENWVGYQRVEHNAGRLDPTRVAELEAVPGWSWNPYAGDWEAALEALRAFAVREGHARVPKGFVEGRLRLGAWVNSRRADRNAGRLVPARVAQLEAIPGWTWDPRAGDWDANLSALRAFAAREGHARPSRSHVEDGLPIGGWVIDQRVRRKGGRLDPARVAELEAIPGWSWDPFADDWASNLAALRVFASREGHARVPKSLIQDGVSLGAWVGRQRVERNAGHLDPARVAELETFPGWSWDPRTDDWASNLAALRVFAAREGHARVSLGHVEVGLRVGAWVNSVRVEGKAGRLDLARTAELEAIPGWTWDPFADDWASNLAALRVFAAREGHARVPVTHVEGGLHLGRWVHGRRVKHKAGRLDLARTAELEAIPGWTWDPFADDWAAHLAALRVFAAREGHARVPVHVVADGLRLGVWVSGRRSERNAGRLDPARASELEAIPGWSWGRSSKT
jgi:superfamily II DNA or RNA helicase